MKEYWLVGEWRPESCGVGFCFNYYARCEKFLEALKRADAMEAQTGRHLTIMRKWMEA